MKLNKLLFLIFIFSIASAQAESIRFKWPSIDDAVLYEIEVYPGPELMNRIKVEQTTKPTTKITSGPGQIYVRVRYKDAFSRWSEYSNLSAITIKLKKIPEVVVVVTEEKPKEKIRPEKPQEIEKKPEPIIVSLPEKKEGPKPWNVEGQLTPAYSTFNLKSDSVKRNESLVILLLNLQKKINEFMLAGDFNFTAIDNGVRPNDYGVFLSKAFYPSLSFNLGAGHYSLTSDSNELNSDIKLYYYRLGVVYEKTIKDNLTLRLSTTLKVGNPLTNKSTQARSHLLYSPAWFSSNSYLDFFLGYEGWSFESQTESLNTTQFLSGIGFLKQF